ncbi:hypothetical protein GA0115239_111911 [Streptomyces sp. BpilaLS-43]|uniref:hypothetical protein n=1 Tax=Streptomyces sp. BpilaLS-43 TaxID=1839778 RepID=UPI00081B8B1D|nr:hypothetical protein [Streptomyces sp. BpilaLS-43]SCD91772.1 hypothetical protein GA0115239_111911 [Streptomyces sp. BpilaLS-43]
MLWHAIAPSRRYTKASHDVVRHPRLSSDAKILLLYVQGLPAERRAVALSEHARTLGITGRAYQKAKKLLVVNGFLHEWRQQGGRGFWATEQLLANVVLSPEEAVRSREAGAGEAAVVPGARKPTVGQPEGPAVGDYRPEEEEREKNSSHPPSEEPPEDGWGPEEVEAERALLSLRRCHRSLHLGVVEARKLVRLAVEWLRRGVTAEEMRRVLTSDLPPDGVRSAVGFLRYRLVRKLPEPPGERAARTAGPEPDRAEGPDPAPLPPGWVTCQGPGDEHVFRPVEGAEGETHCGPCRRRTAWDLWSERRAAQLAAEQAAEDDYRHTPWRERVAALEAERT